MAFLTPKMATASFGIWHPPQQNEPQPAGSVQGEEGGLANQGDVSIWPAFVTSKCGSSSVDGFAGWKLRKSPTSKLAAFNKASAASTTLSGDMEPWAARSPASIVASIRA